MTATCAGAEGTCERPAKKSGFCWGHWKRKMRGLGTAMAMPVREQSSDPLEGLFRAALSYRDELDTATDEDFRRGKERFRFALRQYLWKYVPKLLRRHGWSGAAREEVEAFLATFGDKASHTYPRHSRTPPKKFRKRPSTEARQAVRRLVRMDEIEQEGLHRADQPSAHPIGELKSPKQSHPQHRKKATP